MIKSELALHIASANPHLYQRDVENIVNAILREITNAMAKGDRVELRGFGAFSVKAPSGPHRAQPAHRRSSRGRAEVSAVFQNRQRNARTSKSYRGIVVAPSDAAMVARGIGGANVGLGNPCVRLFG